ncbi:MAG: hypothetical protein V7672_03820 [Brevundimonas sp.]|uniref:hypothetical protein n=1 Tax=Brevundimonas sp. TaxID=1871086 RepID=UPI003001F44A
MIRIQSGPDYSERRSATVAKIYEEGGGAVDVWDEPTSSYILKSEKTASGLCDAIYFDAPIYEDRDMIAVVNLSVKGAGCYSARGLAYPHLLKKLMGAR